MANLQNWSFWFWVQFSALANFRHFLFFKIRFESQQSSWPRLYCQMIRCWDFPGADLKREMLKLLFSRPAVFPRSAENDSIHSGDALWWLFGVIWYFESSRWSTWSLPFFYSEPWYQENRPETQTGLNASLVATKKKKNTNTTPQIQNCIYNYPIDSYAVTTNF